MESHGRKRMISRVAALCLASLLALTSSNAQIPQTLNYQGVLTDAGGTVVPDGNYNIAFKLYDVPAGGTHLWEEAHVVAVGKGIFNVVLGSLVPLALPFDKPYWLGVRVAGGAELTPRIALTSSAYSMNAMSVADNAVTSMMIVDGAVETNDLAAGAVTPAKIAPAATDGLVLTTSGGNVIWQTPSGGALTLPYSGTVSTISPAFSVTNTGTGPGVYGLNSSSIGVFGQSISGVGVGGSSSSGVGMGGESSSGNGVVGKSASGDGVRGESSGSNKSGVYGVNDQSDGFGVYGRNTSNGNIGYLGGKYGVYGESSNDAGVYGSSLNNYGVFGWSFSNNGVTGSSVNGTAVYCAGKFYQTGGVFEAHPTTTSWSTNKPATVTTSGC